MKHNLKAKLKKAVYGVYTYSSSLINTDNDPILSHNVYNGHTCETNITSTRMPFPIRDRRREKKMTDLLKKMEPGFQNAILIITPYLRVVLTAQLLLKTSKPSRVTYTIKGIRGSDDFTTGEKDFSTDHMIPIVGLFEDTKNTVIIHIEAENGEISNKKIRIKMPEVLQSYFDIRIKKTFEKPEIADEKDRFFMVSGGYRGATCIFDSHANTRGLLVRIPQYYGIFNLEKGHFLHSEHFYKRTTFSAPLSVIIQETDWMGRTHKTFFHEIGYHHYAAPLPDGNFVTLSNSFYDTCVENKVIKIDRNTGETLDSFSMNDAFDDTYKTRNDWCHINSIVPMDDPDELLLCMRNIHSICKINLKEKKLIWIMTNPKMFENTAQKDLVLTPEGDFDPWFFQQHSAEIIRDYPNADPNRLYITFYDNHDSARRPVDWYDKGGTAYGLIVSVDEKNRSFRLEKRFPTSYAITRSNTVYDSERGRYFTMDARLAEQTEELAADMREWDFETGELMREYTFNQDFFAIRPFEYDYEELARPLKKEKKYVLGDLFGATPCKRPDGLEKAAPLPQRPDTDMVRLYSDVVCVWGSDQELSEIIAVSDKESYHVDFNTVSENLRLTQPIKYLKEYGFYHLMPLKGIPEGHYDIYVVIKDELYNTGCYVTLHDVKK